MTSEATDQRQFGLYSYAHFSPIPTLTLTIGASFDRVDDPFVDEDGFNPKLGIMWRPTTHTTVRAAAFRTLFGSLTTSPQNPQPRLEPVQLAGFTQLVSVGTADVADVRGFAVDHELTERIFVGWEATSATRIARSWTLYSTGAVEHVNLTERTQHGYFYWTPSDRSASARSSRTAATAASRRRLFGYSHMEIERSTARGTLLRAEQA